ncbi:hypothetical protein ABGB07_02170 [Micromonosporaceae bacterium B7E4]
MASEQRFKCTNCDRAEQLDGVRLGTPAEAARAAGWRIGTNGRNEPVAYCPECSGVDEDYWDRRTLDMTYAAGIDAGNTAWGSS